MLENLQNFKCLIDINAALYYQLKIILIMIVSNKIRDNKIKYEIKGGNYRSNKTTNLLKWFRKIIHNLLVSIFIVVEQ